MWSPPPVALRPLGVGERVDAGVKIFRRNFLTLIKAALVISLVAAVLETPLLLAFTSALRRIANNINIEPASTTPHHVTASTIAELVGAIAAYVIVTWFVVTLTTAVCFRIVVSAYLGNPTTWKQAFSAGMRKILSVMWINLLSFFVFVVPGAVLGGLIILAASSGSGAATGLAGFVLGVAFIVGSVWFWTATWLAIPLLMIEDLKGWKALRRSISLVRTKWWQTFGTLLLAYVLAGIISTVLRDLLELPFAATRSLAVVLIASALLTIVISTLTAAFVAGVQVVVAIDLKVRKEGYDIQLLASQMGTAATASALSFMPAPRGTQGWTYGPPGYGPAGGYGPPGYPPPGHGPPGYPPPGPPGAYQPPGYPPPGYPPPGYPPPGYPSPGGPGGYGPPGYSPPGGPGGYGPPGYSPPGGPGGYGPPGYSPPGGYPQQSYPPPYSAFDQRRGAAPAAPQPPAGYPSPPPAGVSDWSAGRPPGYPTLRPPQDPHGPPTGAGITQPGWATGQPDPPYAPCVPDPEVPDPEVPDPEVPDPDAPDAPTE